MREFTEEDIKTVSLQLLEAFDEFCQKNNLKYSLGFGTLLGSIRHKGFIPWDDDIDVIMPRKDYEDFIRLFTHSKYQIVTCNNNKYYYLPWAKLCDSSTLKIENINQNPNFKIGFNIDIFPLDSVASEKEYNRIRKKVFKKARYINICINKNSSSKVKTAIKKVLKLLIKDPNSYARKIDKLMFNENNNKFVGYYPFFSNKEYLYDASIFENLILNKFEGKEYLITKKYDLFLKNTYGDYMQLPPVEERKTHHDFKAYFL